MIALTQKDVLAHEFVVPWSAPYQVEQDLLLCLAMRAIFEDRFLSHQVAMRGGTVLHKVHLAPAARYSEDIDLVAVGSWARDTVSKRTRAVIPRCWQRSKSPNLLARSLIFWLRGLGSHCFVRTPSGLPGFRRDVSGDCQTRP